MNMYTLSNLNIFSSEAMKTMSTNFKRYFMGRSKHCAHGMEDYIHMFVKICFKEVRMSQLFISRKGRMISPFFVFMWMI